ncbi:helix-turn-helix transcriptional regulator [Virgibacillus sp. AGTR]|uniref:helix-turn-helix domain-containing protein n=1 Tax=Virgibacillus sp. AGTR TaxID=2812055 RepID=UPI001D16A020|nr:helix-turn-helix transcriptional regulator [Virgibacillus sp. AGTR]MCC2251882.1 helix-turn-helix transcriptional regulator [Virgibacillus sp. AGTR]
MNNNMELKIVIGDKLQHLLNINGLKIVHLVKYSNISETTLQDYLDNVKSPTLEDLVQLAELLNTSIDYIMGTSDFILDTWDCDFLGEFIQYSSVKIKEHFEDRQNLKVPYGVNLDTVLFGLLTYSSLSRSGRSFEDLSEDEINVKKEAYTEIMSIFNSCITISNQDCFDIKELRALNRNIIDYLFGDFSFVYERVLKGLDNNPETSEGVRIQLLKAAINQNMERSQMALKLLEGLSGSEEVRY